MKDRALYFRCWICNGTLKTTPLDPGEPCPCVTSSTPGFLPVGLTMDMVEKIIEERDRLHAAAVKNRTVIEGVRRSCS